MTTAKERETLCGLLSWRPKFLQILASTKVYMFFYGVLGIIKSMQYSYMSSTLAMLERKFGIKSKETAILMSGNEIAQILFLFAMPLTVKAKKRPMWCGVGLIISGIGLLLMSMPHFITGYVSGGTDDTVIEDKSRPNGLCGSEVHFNSLEGMCNDDGSRVIDWAGLILFFLGIVLTGIGNSLFYSFGMVYLDDNSSRGNSPKMLAATFTFSLIGPTLGYLLGAKCLNTYVYPNYDPGFQEGDPRWMGAWWIGYLVIGFLLIAFSVPLLFFPQRLPKGYSDASKEAHETEKLNKEDNQERHKFMPALKRLVTNKLYMWNFFSSIFLVLAFMGLGTFMVKYVEYQFRQKGSKSSIVMGLIGTGAKAVGILISGFLVGKFKFSARAISGYNVFLGVIYISSLVVFSMVGCATSQMYGTLSPQGDYEVNTPCNQQCGCPVARPQPVCSKDGVTNFYSPCHAGCTSERPLETGGKEYLNCSCVLTASIERNTSLSRYWVEQDILGDIEYPPLSIIDEMHRKLVGEPVEDASSGWCKIEGCDVKFKQFMIVAGVIQVLASTGRVGNVLVALRSVEVRDKALSMAFQVVFMSLLAMLPSPIVYGAIIDNTCILWQQECGETTNCLLYDTDSLRQVLMLTTAGILSLGVLCDVAVWYYSKDLVIFYPEEEKVPKEELNLHPESGNLRSFQATHSTSMVSLTKDAIYKQ